MRRSAVPALVVGLLLALTACGEDGADDARRAAGTATTGSSTDGSTDSGPAYELPVPTGPDAVGVRRVGAAIIHYPTATGGRPAPLLSEEEVAVLAPWLEVEPTQVAALQGHAVADAAALDGDHPVVLLSAAYGEPRMAYTGLAEELASHGYVVAALEHADAPPASTEGPVDLATEVLPARIADLTGLVDSLAGELDIERLAVVGHSIGGAAAAALVGDDPRVDVGVNLDGAVPGPGGRGVDRPFLTLVSDGHTPAADPTLTAFADELVPVAGTGHLSFSDAPWVVESLPELWGDLEVGSLDAAATHREVSRLVLAFLDEHLA